MKVAIITDTHLGVRNSSEIFLENSRKFYEDIFFPECKKHDIKTIWHLGDYFDNRKSVNIKALSHNKNHFIKHLEENDITMWLVLGNHDVLYKNTIYPNSPQEILGQKDHVKILDTCTHQIFGSKKVLFVPWINSENSSKIFQDIKNSDADVCCGHFGFVGFNFEKNIVSKDGLSTKEFHKFSRVFSGHYHIKSERGNITYLGAPFEFFWSDEDTDKFFHIYDTETSELLPVKNHHKLFNKIYYDEDESHESKMHLVESCKNKFVKLFINNRKSQDLFDQFIDNLISVSPFECKIIDSFYSTDDFTVDIEKIEDTTSIINEYIDNLSGISLDKNRLKSEFLSLMNQAEKDMTC